MSNLQRIENLEQVVNKLEPDFNKIAAVHGAVNFMREASFAMQILKDNSYAMEIALANQDSLKMAVINVAGIGLTLNPIKGLAYLVPRKKKICLHVSYRGFTQLAVECGAILWAKAEPVYENDKYTYHGMGKEPTHVFEPFDKGRGKIMGGYALAKTPTGEYLVDHMTIDEIYDKRDRSEAWKAFKRDASKKGPWNTDEIEMIKKTLILRAKKMWPMTDKDLRFERAVEAEADANPIQLTGDIPNDLSLQILNVAKIGELCAMLDRPVDKLLGHLSRGHRRTIKTLEDLTDTEAKQTIALLEGLVSNMGKKK